MRRPSLILAALLAAGLAASGASASSDRTIYLVYNPGAMERVVGADDPAVRIELRRGETLLAVYPDGDALRVTGPYRGPLSAARRVRVAEDGLLSKLGRMLHRSRTRPTVASTRGDGAQTGSPQDAAGDLSALPPIQLDARGPQCFVEGSPPSIAIPLAGAERVVVVGLVDDASATVRFGPAERTAPWPTSLAPRDGARLVLAETAISTPTRLAPLVRIEPVTGPAMAPVLAEAGCEQQAQAVVDQLVSRAAVQSSPAL